MSKDKHRQRLQALSLLGKPLSRRARSRCELCQQSTSLKIFEVPPLPAEPSEDYAVLLCDRCIQLATTSKNPPPEQEVHFLSEMIWSPAPPVQILAIRICRTHQYFPSQLEDVYLSPELEERL